MEDYCQSFEDLLFEPDEALSGPDRTKLQAHISSCEGCRAEREMFLESWQALEQLQNDSEPIPAVRARVWEQIRAEETLSPPEVNTKLRAMQFPVVPVQRLAVACLALFFGFHFGQGLRNRSEPPKVATTQASVVDSSTPAPDFIDSDLIELASQEGYSMEIFPESTEFSPIDQETLSSVAPTAEERTWLKRRQGAVVPVQYISSQSGGKP